MRCSADRPNGRNALCRGPLHREYEPWGRRSAQANESETPWRWDAPFPLTTSIEKRRTNNRHNRGSCSKTIEGSRNVDPIGQSRPYEERRMQHSHPRHGQPIAIWFQAGLRSVNCGIARPVRRESAVEISKELGILFQGKKANALFFRRRAAGRGRIIAFGVND